MNEYPLRRQLMTPWITREVYRRLNVYAPPRFAEGMRESELLARHVKSLGIGDLLKAAAEGRHIDARRYKSSLLMAEAMEQQARLLHALNETIPLSEKPEDEQALWRAFVEEHRPLYLYATIGQPTVDQLSFVPVLSVRRLESGWQFQLGHDIRFMGIPVEMRHERYWNATLRGGVRAAYKLFQRWRTQEAQALSDYMSGVSLNFLRHATFFGYQERIDPHIPGSRELVRDEDLPAQPTDPAETPNLDNLVQAVFMPNPRNLIPELIVQGMAVGVIPLRAENEYLMVLEPVGDEADWQHKGYNGRDFRFIFTAPNDWMACVYALGYLDAIHPPYMWN